MAAEMSGGSRIAGSGTESDWDDLDKEDIVGVYSDGRIEGKYRWKKMVWRTPKNEEVICQ